MHQRRGVQAEAGAEGRRREAGERAWRGREAGEPPTHSIADGTALHRGRVGSRHFQSLEIRLGALCFICRGYATLLPFCSRPPPLYTHHPSHPRHNPRFFISFHFIPRKIRGERFLFIITIGRVSLSFFLVVTPIINRHIAKGSLCSPSTSGCLVVGTCGAIFSLPCTLLPSWTIWWWSSSYCRLLAYMSPWSKSSSTPCRNSSLRKLQC